MATFLHGNKKQNSPQGGNNTARDKIGRRGEDQEETLLREAKAQALKQQQNQVHARNQRKVRRNQDRNLQDKDHEKHEKEQQLAVKRTQQNVTNQQQAQRLAQNRAAQPGQSAEGEIGLQNQPESQRLDYSASPNPEATEHSGQVEQEYQTRDANAQQEQSKGLRGGDPSSLETEIDQKGPLLGTALDKAPDRASLNIQEVDLTKEKDPGVLHRAFTISPSPEPGEGFRAFTRDFRAEGGVTRASIDLLRKMGLDHQTIIKIRETGVAAEALMSLPIWWLLLMRLNEKMRRLWELGEDINAPTVFRELLEQIHFCRDKEYKGPVGRYRKFDKMKVQKVPGIVQERDDAELVNEEIELAE